MTQSIVVGILALLAGFGIGTTQGDAIVGNGNKQGPQDGSGMNQERMMQADVLAEDFVSVRPGVASLPVEELSTVEESGLIFMREEEKLARDVYLTLYEKWVQKIFNNIAQSEQTHTEAVRGLLEKYDITDPVTDDTVGVFANAELQTLYDQLVEEGSESLVAALRVGATIEDLDIKDLEDNLALTDNEDIAMVYENLQRGSRNHLRSFVSQLEAQGASYEPQYISEDEYESIISSEKETGDGASRGWGGGQGHGGGQGQGGQGGGMGRGH